jgi:hypothetical protein
VQQYEHEELLMELVASPYWKAYKLEVQKVSEGILNKLLGPSKTLVDLVEKEALAARLATLRDLSRSIEEAADRYSQQRRVNKDR